MTRRKSELVAKREYADTYIFTGREKPETPSSAFINLANLATGVIAMLLIYGLGLILGI
jgi:hypothetical protein